MRYFLFRFLQLVAWTLPISMSYALADFGGWVQYSLSAKDRASVRSNLSTLMRQNPSAQEVTRVFQNFGRYLVDFCRMTRVVDKHYVEDVIDVDGAEHIDHVLSQGKGGVILTGHLGNWEVGGAVLAQLGYPFHGVALPHSKSVLNDWFNAQRAACGIESISSQKAVRGCIEVLCQNKLIAIVADRDFSETGVRMPFLGRDFLVPKGAAVFAYKTGAGVIPTFFYQQKNGRWCLKCFEPIYADQIVQGKISDEQIVSFSQQFLPLFDTMIREYATQWLMFREYGKEV